EALVDLRSLASVAPQQAAGGVDGGRGPEGLLLGRDRPRQEEFLDRLRRERARFEAGEGIDGGGLERAGRRRELGAPCALGDLGHDRRPEWRRGVERELAVVGGAVAVTHPDPDG